MKNANTLLYKNKRHTTSFQTELYAFYFIKIAALKNSFENCKQMYDVYTDIAKTYYDISKGDYISNLIEEKKREEKQQKNTIIYRRSKGR